MKKLRAVIVDDERFARESLKNLLIEYCSEVEIADSAYDLSSAVRSIADHKPDVVFLDIHLASENSFQLFELIENIDFDVVFTTGDNGHGIPAIKVNAVDYLLKPIDANELKLAIRRIIGRRHQAEGHKTKENVLTAHYKGKVETIPFSKIVSMEAHNSYTDVITNSGQNYVLSKTLGEIGDAMFENPEFIRIHRSVIVNANYITSYSKVIPFEIVLSNGKVYEISRRKRSDVIQFLKNKLND
jgi:two-component system, LytTR family, response regulator